ncbi:MAG: hypothetical protein GY698_06010, partial [Actinomycetia bacterium]|nr:hypothetical protein [Actinomycetes bacterium]
LVAYGSRSGVQCGSQRRGGLRGSCGAFHSIDHGCTDDHYHGCTGDHYHGCTGDHDHHTGSDNDGAWG